VTVEVTVEIGRSPEDAFDYLTDVTNEAEWNPRTRRVEKLTEGPIGSGTRFGAEWIKGNPMVVEYVCVRASDRLDIGRSFSTLGCQGRGADLADGARLPPDGQGRAATQGPACAAVALGWLERVIGPSASATSVRLAERHDSGLPGGCLRDAP
jgi:uncharacterized protein YndB with AHSA1/START domain